jgi:internalin A
MIAFSESLMSSHSDGITIARTRIAREKEERSGFLDLGRLGLSELPEEIFEVGYLWGLNLGYGWRDGAGEWQNSISDLASNQVSRFLCSLPRLPGLTFLSISNTNVSDLSPVVRLRSLRSLNLWRTEVLDISPLKQVHALQSLDCSMTPISDISPLKGLYGLQSLDCSRTAINDLSPLKKLRALQSLDCSRTFVEDIAPLSGLHALQSFTCRRTEVSDLSPLAQLFGLQLLNCSRTKVGEVSPLRKLHALRTLDLAWTKVSDLSHLTELYALQVLSCYEIRAGKLPESLVSLPSLNWFSFSSPCIDDIPHEVQSRSHTSNCLDGLRAHLRDLAGGTETVPDVKVLVLGNGLTGKTQICRRLRGESFEQHPDSTHGIRVTSATISVPRATSKSRQLHRAEAHAHDTDVEQTPVHIWDFGGQDLYHGTHALFMCTRSLFLLVWTQESENALEYEHKGITFRNYPMSYWLSYVRHTSGAFSPLLIVQNKCDSVGDEAPAPPKSVQQFAFRRLLRYSAKNNRGRKALEEALRQAILWLRETTGQARIGKGRSAVKRKLEALRDEDAQLETKQRKHRTITQEFFRDLCSRAGGVSSPELLLEYLHNAGIVFYQKGIFDNQILLDQDSALEAVYAVFHRERCYRQLRQLQGRFWRSLLEELVWGDYGVEEQQLFLSLMVSCGVCFVLSPGDRKGEMEAVYIAPDLLPGREAIADAIDEKWGGPESRPDIVFELPMLHHGVMRAIISKVGQTAGGSALYWKYGACIHEKQTRSVAIIEQKLLNRPKTWSGSITISTTGRRAAELLRSLRELVRGVIEQCGCQDWSIKEASEGLGDRLGAQFGEAGSAEDGPVGMLRVQKPAPPSTTSAKKTYFVSYARSNESMAIVERLSQDAKRRGIDIVRDTTGVGIGDSISAFMHELGAGDRVIVILSERYLKSPYCMTELVDVWRNCKEEEKEFRKRIKVYVDKNVNIKTPQDRMKWAEFWELQYKALEAEVRKKGLRLLAEADFRHYNLMRQFANRVGDILFLINDTLQPTDLEELVKYGFDD